MADKYRVLEWQQILYDQYMTVRKRVGCALSTERTIHAAIFSFFTYMNDHGISSMEAIMAPDLKQWHITSEHKTARARNLYTSQLRLFLEYLADAGILRDSLPLALSCQHAPYTTVVTTLSKEQLDMIAAYRVNASTPMQLRDSAMIMLGLKMGMRGVDICNLKLSDISWRRNTITFTQQKTGVYIELPMPVDVGNSLYRYITEGRPSIQQDIVFLSDRPPYHPLKPGAPTRAAMNHVLRQRSKGKAEFHITRRTFASHMLRSGNPIPIIAATLGHAGLENVASYLSTDDDNLKKCAIGCEGIGYTGRYGL